MRSASRHSRPMSSRASEELPAADSFTRPPLKWAGSKYRILCEIKRLLPAGERLVEPFAGSGAVFLNTGYPRYLINDVNKDLILFYKTLKARRAGFIRYCERLFSPRYNNASAYYELRTEFNSTANEHRRAAIFLYINRHGYNGLCRYNSAGELNVPFGRYRAPYFPKREMLAFLTKAPRVRIENRDFTEVFRSSKHGDVIYCDPPYVPLSATSNFTSYSAGGFGKDEQHRLAQLAEEAVSRGIPVLISNHQTNFTERLYANAELHRFSVRRSISCNGDKRDLAAEMLALFVPSTLR